MSNGTVTRRLEAGVTCLHCGRSAGLLRRELEKPDAPTTFDDGSGGAPVPVGSLTALRCTRCRGSLYVQDYRVVDVYPSPHLLERPRRGRPPKRRTAPICVWNNRQDVDANQLVPHSR